MDNPAGSGPRRLLLAGSVGPERAAARPDVDDTRWFEPLHVRDEAASRSRIGQQIAAGADAVLAPTWRTHRRALLPLGETRRARHWTAMAVQVAREAVEVGMELRAEAKAGPDAATGTAVGSESSSDNQDAREASALLPRAAPMVGAVLPALDEQPEMADGRLLPREAATARDYRDQAGLLADTEPDFILVEGQHSPTESRTAVEEAAMTGLPIWVVAPVTSAPRDDGVALARWLETSAHAGASVLILPEPMELARIAIAETTLRWGATIAAAALRDTAPIGGWLERGASLIAILDGATAAAVSGARTAIDAVEEAEMATTTREAERWRQFVSEAAQVAAGGSALWLGAAPDAALPGGFDWLVVDASEGPRLPRSHYKLIVIPDTLEAVGAPAQLLEDRGVLAARGTTPPHLISELRLVDRRDDELPVMALYRRED